MKICVLLCGLVLVSCFAAASLAQDYVVGEGDILKISVYDHDDLTTVARVSGEGVIVLPLIGQVEVQGLTISQITQKISALLADGYLVDPQVSIFIQEFRSKKAFIMGEVTSTILSKGPKIRSTGSPWTSALPRTRPSISRSRFFHPC